MTKQKNENSVGGLLFNLLFNIVIPVIILSKWTTPDRFGPIYGLVIALLFPTGYFLYDLIKERKTNFISIIGFVGIFLTGIIGVFEFPSEWIAYKEASVPLLIGLSVLISLKTPFPLVRKILYNEQFLNTTRIETILKEQNKEKLFDKVLVYATYMLSASFLLSSVLNFTLAKVLIKSPSGTEAFAQELGKMTALSYPVIALPSTVVMIFALWYLFHQLKKLTGLTMEELFAEHLQEKMKDSTNSNEEA